MQALYGEIPRNKLFSPHWLVYSSTAFVLINESVRNICVLWTSITHFTQKLSSPYVHIRTTNVQFTILLLYWRPVGSVGLILKCIGYYYYHHHHYHYHHHRYLLYAVYLYIYIPETNHVPGEYSVAAILSLLFMVLIPIVPALALLRFYLSTFRTLCAVPNTALFFGSLTSLFPIMFLTYFMNDNEMVPVAPIITGITLVFTFHMRFFFCCKVFIYFKIFSASF